MERVLEDVAEWHRGGGETMDVESLVLSFQKM